MTKQQLQITLEKAEKMEFLDLIEFLTGEEKTYKKGEFYKKTQIPLLVLFKEHMAYKAAKEGILSKLLKNLSTFEDYDGLVGKVSNFIDVLGRDTETVLKIQSFLDGILNMEQLQELAQTLKVETTKLKN